MDLFLQILLNGVLIGGMFALISIGLTLVFGVVRIVNFAHGDFLMVGMYFIYLLHDRLELHPYAGIVPAVLLLFIIGCLVQRLILQRLLDASEEIKIFATMGLSLILMNSALILFGADIYTIPATTQNTAVQIGTLSFDYRRILIFVAALAVTCGIYLFLRTTYFGRAIRAVAQDGYAAQLMGINMKRVYVVTFGLGLGTLGIAAGLMAPLYPVFPTLGTYFILTAFVVIVLGGMGSIYGVLVGSLIIGVIDTMAGYYLSPDLKEVVYFVVFIFILLVKPGGLFGLGTE